VGELVSEISAGVRRDGEGLRLLILRGEKLGEVGWRLMILSFLSSVLIIRMIDSTRLGKCRKCADFT
jgi:hypothetical protein